MGSLVVRKKSRLATVGKIGVGLAVIYVGAQLLPVVVGAGIVAAFLGAAAVAVITSVVGWFLSLALWIGVPVFCIAFLIALFSSDD